MVSVLVVSCVVVVCFVFGLVRFVWLLVFRLVWWYFDSCSDVSSGFVGVSSCFAWFGGVSCGIISIVGASCSTSSLLVFRVVLVLVVLFRLACCCCCVSILYFLRFLLFRCFCCFVVVLSFRVVSSDFLVRNFIPNNVHKGNCTKCTHCSFFYLR